MPAVVEAHSITKRFPGVVANRNVSITLERGEVHALLGENGAGKSTLVNILYGLYAADEGEIFVNGEKMNFVSPHEAIHQGIGMVHQHFMLVPVMTVAENMMLGEEATIGSTAISAAAAAAVGAVFGWLLGGPVIALLWVIAAAGYFVLSLGKWQPGIGRVSFGTLSGLAVGLIIEIIARLAGTAVIEFPVWVPLGIVLGTLANLRWLDKRSVTQRIRSLSAEYGLDVDPKAMVGDLPVGAQQRVEIIKALYRDAKVLILDEPTAVLTPQEADDLFGIMRQLVERGVSIIFITHKLREVFAIADRITVLRRGEVVGVTTPNEASLESLARMMVGREVLLQVRKKPAEPGDAILQIRELVVEDDRHHQAIRGVSFTVHSGEIVGIAGVQGNGQTELVEAITRLRQIKSGDIQILAHNVTHQTARLVTSLGIGHIPEDRQRHGLVLNYPVADNMILSDYYETPFSNRGILDEDYIGENAQKLIKQYDIRTPSIFTPASSLSGGNQQKVIVARELAREPHLLIANQPTRGLDVGSIEFIHNQTVAARDAGAGVLLVSAELDEIMSLSDRILVMYQGRIMADLLTAEATREQLGLLMAGVS